MIDLLFPIFIWAMTITFSFTFLWSENAQNWYLSIWLQPDNSKIYSLLWTSSFLTRFASFSIFATASTATTFTFLILLFLFLFLLLLLLILLFILVSAFLDVLILISFAFSIFRSIGIEKVQRIKRKIDDLNKIIKIWSYKYVSTYFERFLSLDRLLSLLEDFFSLSRSERFLSRSFSLSFERDRLLQIPIVIQSISCETKNNLFQRFKRERNVSPGSMFAIFSFLSIARNVNGWRFVSIVVLLYIDQSIYVYFQFGLKQLKCRKQLFQLFFFFLFYLIVCFVAQIGQKWWRFVW